MNTSEDFSCLNWSHPKGSVGNHDVNKPVLRLHRHRWGGGIRSFTKHMMMMMMKTLSYSFPSFSLKREHLHLCKESDQVCFSNTPMHMYILLFLHLSSFISHTRLPPAPSAGHTVHNHIETLQPQLIPGFGCEWFDHRSHDRPAETSQREAWAGVALTSS